MDGEYRTLSNQGIETNILFFGQVKMSAKITFLNGNNCAARLHHSLRSIR